MKKLQLKKEVVAKLNDDQMNRVKGGIDADPTKFCIPSTKPDCPRPATHMCLTNEETCKSDICFTLMVC